MMLGGVRILDMSWLGPGSVATWLMADLGAEVIRLEPADGSDRIRAFPPFYEGVSVAHLSLSRGKRSLAADIQQPAGRDAVLAVARDVDAVVDGMRPGVAERLGIGYPQLSAQNPRLTYCSISGFGNGGPLAETAAHDLNYVARAGVLSLLPNAMLYPPPAQTADFIGAALAAFSVTAGILRARATGRGGKVETSLFDSAVFAVSLLHAQALVGIEHLPGAHFLVGGLAAYAVYECADGQALTVGALEPQFWRNLCELAGLDDGALGDHWDPARQPELRRRLTETFRTRDRDDWIKIFAGHDVCVEPVVTVGEASRDPHQQARGRYQHVRHPVTGKVVDMPASPVIVGDRTSAVADVPDVGSDTRDLLLRAGYSNAQVDALISARAVTADDT